jgi:hypothetical protein
MPVFNGSEPRSHPPRHAKAANTASPAATRLHEASHSPSIGYPGETAIPYHPSVMARRDEATETA